MLIVVASLMETLWLTRPVAGCLWPTHERRRAGGPSPCPLELLYKKVLVGIGVALILVIALVVFVVTSGSEDEAVVEAGGESAAVVEQELPTVEAPTATGGFVPDHISIPAIDVDAVVEPKGTVQQYAPYLDRVVPSFGAPEEMEDTTWWSDGPQPGSDGMAIILGHTLQGDDVAVFDHIDTLSPGSTIEVQSSDGSSATYSVTEVVDAIPKDDPIALNDALEGAPADSGLALVTCGGEFDTDLASSDENVIVFASLVSMDS